MEGREGQLDVNGIVCGCGLDGIVFEDGVD